MNLNYVMVHLNEVKAKSGALYLVILVSCVNVGGSPLNPSSSGSSYLPTAPLYIQHLLFHNIFLSCRGVLLPAAPLFLFHAWFHPLVFLHYWELESLVFFLPAREEVLMGRGPAMTQSVARFRKLLASINNSALCCRDEKKKTFGAV